MIDSGTAVAIAAAALGVGLALAILVSRRAARGEPGRGPDVVAPARGAVAQPCAPLPRDRAVPAASRGARPRNPEQARQPIEEVEEQIFWFRLLAPLQGADPGLQERWLVDLASRAHHHPRKGKQFFDRATLQRQFESVRGLTLEGLQARARALQQDPPAVDAAASEAPVDATAASPSRAEPEPERAAIPISASDSDDGVREGEQPEPRPLAEEVFWFNLLAPLREIAPHLRRDALVTLGSRPHQHPLQGHRLFDTATLERELAWVVDADPEALHARWQAAAFAGIGMAPDTGTILASEGRSGVDPAAFAPLDEPEVDLVLEHRLSGAGARPEVEPTAR